MPISYRRLWSAWLNLNINDTSLHPLVSSTQSEYHGVLLHPDFKNGGGFCPSNIFSIWRRVRWNCSTKSSTKKERSFPCGSMAYASFGLLPCKRSKIKL